MAVKRHEEPDQLQRSLSAAANLVLSSDADDCISWLDASPLGVFADRVDADAAWDTMLVLARQLKLARALLKILRRQAAEGLDADSAMALMAGACQDILGPIRAPVVSS